MIFTLFGSKSTKIIYNFRNFIPRKKTNHTLNQFYYGQRRSKEKPVHTTVLTIYKEGLPR